jgi:hypothetical protein
MAPTPTIEHPTHAGLRAVSRPKMYPIRNNITMATAFDRRKRLRAVSHDQEWNRDRKRGKEHEEKHVNGTEVVAAAQARLRWRFR